MEKINSLSLSKMRVASYVGFLRSVLTTIKGASDLTTNTKFLALVQSLLDEFQVLEEVVRRQQALLLTPEVTAADKLRDNTMMQLKHLVTAATYSSVAVEKTAGDKLSIIIKPYAKDYRDQMAEETEDLRGLLAQLGAEEMVEYIDALVLGPVLQRLRQQNNAFDVLYRQRGQDRATTRGTGVSTTDQRKVTDDLYRQVIEYLNNVIGVIDMGIDSGFSTEALAKVANDINATIEQYKINLDNQNKKSKKDEDEDPDTEEI